MLGAAGCEKGDRKPMCPVARPSEFFMLMHRLLLLLAFFLVSAPSARAGDFALHDGDTVVFLGDSITAARTYGKIIENYTLLRFPDRKVRFINAGVGGDTAAGGLRRLDRDVFAHKPTVLLVAYGVNDIGWGTKADDQHKKLYLQGVRGIVEACNEHKVRVYICSAAITAEDPAKAEKGFLQTMCDEGMELSRSLGGHSIDVDARCGLFSERCWPRTRRSPTRTSTTHCTRPMACISTISASWQWPLPS